MYDVKSILTNSSELVPIDVYDVSEKNMSLVAVASYRDRGL